MRPLKLYDLGACRLTQRICFNQWEIQFIGKQKTLLAGITKEILN